MGCAIFALQCAISFHAFYVFMTISLSSHVLLHVGAEGQDANVIECYLNNNKGCLET